MLKSVADDDDDDELASEQPPSTLQMGLRKCVRCVLVHPHHHQCSSANANSLSRCTICMSSYGVMTKYSWPCIYVSTVVLAAALLQHWRMSNLWNVNPTLWQANFIIFWAVSSLCSLSIRPCVIHYTTGDRQWPWHLQIKAINEWKDNNTNMQTSLPCHS